jgi:hypothetical protein
MTIFRVQAEEMKFPVPSSAITVRHIHEGLPGAVLHIFAGEATGNAEHGTDINFRYFPPWTKRQMEHPSRFVPVNTSRGRTPYFLPLQYNVFHAMQYQ